MKNPTVTKRQIKWFLTELRNGDVNDIKYRKKLINAFVRKIYLYDDKMTILFNSQDGHFEAGFELGCSFYPQLAGETRFEHATNGFGDHYSTVEPLPYVCW